MSGLHPAETAKIGPFRCKTSPQPFTALEAKVERRKKLADRRPPIGYFSAMSESLQVTIVYEQGEDGWIVASIPEVPGAHSQGQTREEARANVIDALRGILELRFGEHPAVAKAADSEPLELVIGA
jgi:predicted RNase H-like HicB family nuclease